MNDRPQLDSLHGLLLLAPVLVLAWHGVGAPLDGAPDTISIGTAVAALGAIPSLVLATLRARGRQSLGLPLLLILVAFAGYSIPSSTDTFGGWRAFLALAAGAGYTVSAAMLGASGRRVIQRGLPVIGLVLLASTVVSENWVGIAGNSGDTSEAILPCAILGGGAFLNAVGPLAFTGFACLFAFAFYAGFVPVYAGALGLVAALVAALAASVFAKAGGEAGRQGAAKRSRLLLIAMLMAILPIGFRALTDATAPRDAAAAAAASGPLTLDQLESPEFVPDLEPPTTTGGIGFRIATWKRTPELIQQHLRLGVGAGQFQAVFPPYRDPAEIEASSFDRREPTPIEVEHAHNDWLTALAEHGLVGGGALFLFLIVMLVRSLRLAGGDDPSRRDFALAAIAILANSLVNSPLLYGVISPIIAFTVLGIVSASHKEDESGRIIDHLGPGLMLVALCLVAPRANDLLSYGRALAGVRDARVVLDDGRERLEAGALGTVLDTALGFCPEAPIALEKRAQLLRTEGAAVAVQRDLLEHWISLRPHSLGAHLAAGSLEARNGQLEAARGHFEQAYSLDPGHPALLRNLVRLGCDRRDPAAVTFALGNLRQSARFDPTFVRERAIAMTLSLRLDVAQALLDVMIADAPDLSSGAETWEAYRAAQAADDEDLARAYRNAARLCFAREHLAQGLPEQALGQLQPAYQDARDGGQNTSAARLHLAAARALAGQAERAREAIEESPVNPYDFGRLDEAGRRALQEAGLAPRSSAIEAPAVTGSTDN